MHQHCKKGWAALGHVGQHLQGDCENFVSQACKLCFCPIASTRVAQEWTWAQDHPLPKYKQDWKHSTALQGTAPRTRKHPRTLEARRRQLSPRPIAWRRHADQPIRWITISALRLEFWVWCMFSNTFCKGLAPSFHFMKFCFPFWTIKTVPPAKNHKVDNSTLWIFFSILNGKNCARNKKS